MGTSSLYFADGSKIPGARIDGSVRASRMMGAGNEGPIATRGRTMTNPAGVNPALTAGLQRQQNIAAARADGTFDAKRNAFNAANKGSFMDEQGNIGPRAPLAAGNPNVERVPVSNPQAPTASTPAAKPAAEPMGPRKPATFEGKSRAEFFGAAAQRQGVNNAYSNEALAQAKPTTPPAAPAPTGSMFNRAMSAAKEGMFGTSPAAVVARSKTLTTQPPTTPTPTVASAPAKPAPAAPGFGAPGGDTRPETIKAAPAPLSSSRPAPTTTPAPAAPVSAPPPPPTQPSQPGYFAKKIAQNPDGIFGKVADVAGKAKRGFMSAVQEIGPMAANAAASAINTAVVQPAIGIRKAISERAANAPTGAMAKLDAVLPKDEEDKKKPVVTASRSMKK